MGSLKIILNVLIRRILYEFKNFIIYRVFIIFEAVYIRCIIYFYIERMRDKRLNFRYYRFKLIIRIFL